MGFPPSHSKATRSNNLLCGQVQAQGHHKLRGQGGLPPISSSSLTSEEFLETPKCDPQKNHPTSGLALFLGAWTQKSSPDFLSLTMMLPEGDGVSFIIVPPRLLGLTCIC